MLGGLRARLDEDPVLVVPTFADVEHAQRELAERGAIFGARVMRFEWLFGEIAARVGFAGRRASDFQRELIVEEAVRRARLDVLAESASQPGFVRAAAHFFAELGQVRNEVSAARLTRALRDWAGDGPRRQYADEIAAIYRAYREGLEAAGLVDAELYARATLDALRTGGARTAWGRTPVFVYGFDDFNGLQLDALETLSRHCDVDVTVSLPYERGRLAFRSVSGVHQELLAIGGDELELAPLDDHYAEESRAALHQVERRLFEDGSDERADPGQAISFHSAGGERAEVELVAKRLLELLRTDVAPGDVAVVFREPTAYSSLLEQVFGAYGIPYSIDRTLPFGHTGLGRGLLALIRAAGPAGTADDLLAYLRTPGLLQVPGFADSLEAEVRREGEHSAAEARARWERDRLAARGAGPAARAPATPMPSRPSWSGASRTLFAAPYRRTATVLSGPQLDEARAFAAAAEGARRAARGARLEAGRCRPGAARDGAARGARGREAPAGPRAGGGSRGDPRAPLRGGLLLRPPGGRVPARRLARAVPVRRRPRGRSPPPAGSCSPCARTGSTASATCSTSAPRARSACSCSAPGRATRRATRRPSRSSWTTCASCSSTAPSAARARCPRSPGRPRTRPRPRSGTARHAATGPRRPRAGHGPAQLRAAARRAVAPRCRVGPARSRTSPTARSSGWSRTCCGRRSSSPIPSRWCAARYAHEVLEPHLRAAARGDRRAAA